jgi:predicted permease
METHRAMLDDFTREIRLTLSGLRRTPGFTAAVSLSLALAFAAAAITAVVVAAYLVRPLPYAHAERLYHVSYAPPGPWEPAGLALLDWTALGDVVEMPVAARGGNFSIREAAGFSAPYRMLHASPGFIDGLDVRAAVGRSLAASDYQESAAPAAMISHRVWRDHFASDPRVTARTLAVETDGRERQLVTFRVVGVLPDGFWFGRDSRDLVDLIAPLMRPAQAYRVRLRPGASAALAERRITEAVRGIASDLPPDWAGVTLESARDRYVAGVRPVLLGAVVACTVILAIACANAGVLALLRTSRRRREFAVRLTLGAGHLRIARLMLIEATLLVGAALAIGIGLARAALSLWGPDIARQLGRPAPGGETALSLDADILPVVAGIAVLGLIVVGILPIAARAVGWHRRIAEALRRDQRTSSEDRGTRRWRQALMALQVAGALTLLVGGALTTRSLVHMVRTDFGVRTDGLVRVGIDVPSGARPESAGRYRAVAAALGALAGRPVALFQWPQFAETPKQPVETDGAGTGAVEMGVVPVNTAYFDTLEIRLLQGRPFTSADRPGSEPTVIVSRSAARRLWPDRSALGRQVLVADRYISGERTRAWRTVVGVVADVRQGYDDRDLADVYVPLEQTEWTGIPWVYMPVGERGPAWEPDIRRLAASLDPRASVRIAVPLSEEAARLWASPRFMAAVIAMLAVIAVLLTVLGIYGVTAFSLEQRSRDVAIRWALGATGGALARSLMAEAAAVVALGLAGGLAGALSIGRVLASQLHGLAADDVATLAGSAATIAIVACASAAVPAVRAARGDHLRWLGEG